MALINSWGRLSKEQSQVIVIDDDHQAEKQIKNRSLAGLAFGMRRSYGDVCLNSNGILWDTTRLDHFISFDNFTGKIVCEAGVLIRDLQQVIIQQGWVLPVTPGTQMITVGGAIANDVHGKNHNSNGSFGDHVKQITLLRTDGELIECSPLDKADWFEATVGGLGLTGLIIKVEIQLKPIPGPWLVTQTTPYDNLDGFFQLADGAKEDWEHTVSWVDCITEKSGRGLFVSGNYTSDGKNKALYNRRLKLAFTPPFSLVNKFTVKTFNRVYYAIGQRKREQSVKHYQRFFYPLDDILEWNRIYGPKGFYQYQCVVPKSTGADAIQEMIKQVSHYGEGSFLAVLKTFGDRKSPGMLSFTTPGVTLALDFPNNEELTKKLFARLDAVVLEAKGRLYMAKDARMPKKLFESGYPRITEFTKFRDPGISSNLSRRLLGY